VKQSKIKINENVFNSLVCETEDEISSGMMNKQFDDSYNAMIFPLNKKYGCFWTKNCIIPLDIIFVENNIITKIHHMCKPCTDDEFMCKKYYGYGDLVVELEGGSCESNLIYEGDKIAIN